ncbi:hypothetical protein NSA47_10775 [Irregularibacter muris]|uniref:DUF3139 domain-containing protein n=1 Tax=Irregularibacter muris TaxID=1796619 RepID=A0AAE3HIU8_9FIRM|nr:hypothetical protein [Irregularibacter muris]MCR1899468.1 hypothetical protein [Irregularibacter muris]
MKKKRLIIFSAIILLIIAIIYSSNVSHLYYGWFYIIDKYKEGHSYYINCYDGQFELMDEQRRENIKKEQQEREISVRDNYTFLLYFEETKDPKEMTISEIWKDIQPGKSYMMRLKKNAFPLNLYRAYTIEELYLY